MNEIPPISSDDVQDVIDLTKELDAHAVETLKDVPKNLALSALMSSSINGVLAICDTIDEVILHRNVLIHMMDEAIRSIGGAETEPTK